MTKAESSFTQRELQHMVSENEFRRARLNGVDLWKSLGLRNQLMSEISDTYKSLNGFRPRPVWSDYNLVALWNWAAELQAEIKAAHDNKIKRAKLAITLANAKAHKRRVFDKSFNRIGDILSALIK
jgi:hypothetical protein